MSETDFIVVGAGTAGCAVAARLAEDPSTSVALIEAGGPYRRVLDIPLVGLWAWLRRPQLFCWDDWTEPQTALGGRRVWWPAGRLVGGSSAINAMIYSRGAAESYNRWRDEGATNGDIEWSYDALLPYFRRTERQERGASAYHGIDGPVTVSDSRYPNELASAFVAGCQTVGIPPTDDFNAEKAEGAGLLQVTQRGGRRSGARNYLHQTPGGKRVTVHLRSQVVRILMEKGRATGIEVVTNGIARRLRARREVILCAGVIRSPQLLMRSGIGPTDLLRKLGIPVVVESAGVGANLRDHVRIPVVRRWHRSRPTRGLGLARAAVEYLGARRGLLTSNVCDAAAIVRPPGAPVPSLRIVCQWRALPTRREACVNFEVVLIDPHSHGRLWLKEDARGRPQAIDPRYLTDPRDLERLVEGVELARAIAESEPCRRAGVGPEMLPGPDDVVTHARRQANSAYHPVGTCRLGAEPPAVVDLQLRVFGVRGLRVVDASVMPTTVAGNAQAAVLAIAERASDLIQNGERSPTPGAREPSFPPS